MPWLCAPEASGLRTFTNFDPDSYRERHNLSRHSRELAPPWRGQQAVVVENHLTKRPKILEMNKKSRVRAGLTFGIAMTIFFILQNLLTNDNLSIIQIIKTIVAGLIGGVVSGFLFGWLIGLFANLRFVARTTKIETEPGETILLETLANHFKGIEGVGGKLYLTNRRLIFKSHKLNLQNHQLSINLADIKSYDSYKILGVVNNGLSVTTVNGSTEKFAVYEVKIGLNI